MRAAKQAASRSGRRLELGSGQAYTQLAPDLIFMTMRCAPSIYMFAESKTLRMGIRYDIGNRDGWNGMLNFQSNPLGEITGGFIEAQAAQRKDLRGKSIRIAKHTLGQWLTWHVLVVGSEQITCKLDKPYSFNPMRGTNCLSWTMGASAKAVAISRLPL